MRTEDASTLPLRQWLPAPAAVDAVVVAVHGFDDYSLAFAGAGPVLAAHGIAVYAYDQRGFGATAEHGYWPGVATLTADLATMIDLVADRHPGKPVFVLGESMGGAVAMVTLAERRALPVSGVILVAPAVWTRDSMTLLERGALWVTSHTVPWLTLTGGGLRIQASDNIDMLRQMGADPLVIKGTRIDAIAGLCDLMDQTAAAAPELHLPTLVLYGYHDEVIPPAPMLAMIATLPRNQNPPVAAFYADGYHMLLRDLNGRLVIDDIAAWIAHPDRPLPSGADRRGPPPVD